MKKFNRIFIIIAVLLVIAGLIIITLLEKKDPATTPPTITPTIISAQLSPTPTPYPFVPQSTVSSLISELPHKTDRFRVEYYPTTEKFFVTVLGDEYTANYRAAVTWLTQQGVPAPANNAQVQFIFAGYRTW